MTKLRERQLFEEVEKERERGVRQQPKLVFNIRVAFGAFTQTWQAHQ
jgi:hypothetical protein